MLRIKKGTHLKHFLNKFEFHQGYNQFNTNKRPYGVCQNDTIVFIPEKRQIVTNDRPWISSKYYYTYGGDEKFYDIVKSGVLEKVSEGENE